MSVRFINWRVGFYVALFLLSGTVLGLAGNFASLFLPHLHKDFTIFALFVPSLTIFILMLTLQWSQPRIEVVAMFILLVLWISMGSWANDIIGHIQCDALAGQRFATKDGGDMSAQAYCYEMKVIEAFSWTNFILFTLGFIAILVLASKAEQAGHYTVWRDPIQDLPWFSEYHSNPHNGMMPMQYMPGQGGYVPYSQPGGPQIQQGRTLLIQPHIGQQPTITEIPYGAAGGV